MLPRGDITTEAMKRRTMLSSVGAVLTASMAGCSGVVGKSLEDTASELEDDLMEQSRITVADLSTSEGDIRGVVQIRDDDTQADFVGPILTLVDEGYPYGDVKYTLKFSFIEILAVVKESWIEKYEEGELTEENVKHRFMDQYEE